MKFALALVCLFLGSALALPTAVPAADERLYTDCGGVIRISENGTSVLSYKENETLSIEERCVWSLLPDDDLFLSTITIHVDVNGFRSQEFSAGFGVLSWSDRGFIDEDQLWIVRDGEDLTYQTSQAFLIFSSGFTASPTAQGFRLSISGTKSESAAKVDKREVLHFSNGGTSCEGEYVRPSNFSVVYPEFPEVTYPDNTKFAVVTQRSTKRIDNLLNIDFLDTEAGLDVLEVLYLRPFEYRDGVAFKEGSFSGKHTAGIDETISSSESRIVLFSSDVSGGGRGFKLNFSF